MARMRVRQSEGSGFHSRPGQIACFHGVKTRLSTLATGDFPLGLYSMENSSIVRCFGYFGNWIRFTFEIEDSISHFASSYSSHLQFDSRRFHPETT